MGQVISEALMNLLSVQNLIFVNVGIFIGTSIITVQAAAKYQSVQLPSHRLLRVIQQAHSVIQIQLHLSQKLLNCEMQSLSLHSRYRH